MRFCRMATSLFAMLVFATLGSQAAYGVGPSDDVPPDVMKWFEVEAKEHVVFTMGPIGGENPYGFPDNFSDSVQVGKPIAQYVYPTDFLKQAEPSIKGFRPLDEWIAPIILEGKAVGTISAFRADDGSVSSATGSNDMATGQALIEITPTAVFVYDGMNGTILIDGDKVRQVQGGPTEYRTVDCSIKDYQAALQDQADEIARVVAEKGGGPVFGAPSIQLADYVGVGETRGPWSPWVANPTSGWIPWAVGTGIVLLLLGGVFGGVRVVKMRAGAVTS